MSLPRRQNGACGCQGSSCRGYKCSCKRQNGKCQGNKSHNERRQGNKSRAQNGSVRSSHKDYPRATYERDKKNIADKKKKKGFFSKLTGTSGLKKVITKRLSALFKSDHYRPEVRIKILDGPMLRIGRGVTQSDVAKHAQSHGYYQLWLLSPNPKGPVTEEVDVSEGGRAVEKKSVTFGEVLFAQSRDKHGPKGSYAMSRIIKEVNNKKGHTVTLQIKIPDGDPRNVIKVKLARTIGAQPEIVAIAKEIVIKGPTTDLDEIYDKLIETYSDQKTKSFIRSDNGQAAIQGFSQTDRIAMLTKYLNDALTTRKKYITLTFYKGPGRWKRVSDDIPLGKLTTDHFQSNMDNYGVIFQLKAGKHYRSMIGTSPKVVPYADLYEYLDVTKGKGFPMYIHTGRPSPMRIRLFVAFSNGKFRALKAWVDYNKVPYENVYSELVRAKELIHLMERPSSNGIPCRCSATSTCKCTLYGPDHCQCPSNNCVCRRKQTHQLVHAPRYENKQIQSLVLHKYPHNPHVRRLVRIMRHPRFRKYAMLHGSQRSSAFHHKESAIHVMRDRLATFFAQTPKPIELRIKIREAKQPGKAHKINKINEARRKYPDSDVMFVLVTKAPQRIVARSATMHMEDAFKGGDFTFELDDVNCTWDPHTRMVIRITPDHTIAGVKVHDSGSLQQQRRLHRLFKVNANYPRL